MANIPLKEILVQIESICKKYEVEHLYLFGSYAADTATTTSDIDIAIKGGINIYEMKEQIDQIKTLKKIDVLEYDKCRNELLKEDIDLYGKQIY